MFEYICIAGCVSSFAMLHTFYRIAAKSKCRPQAVNLVFLAWAATGAALAAILLQRSGYRLPAGSEPRFLALACVTGALVAVAVIFYLLAVRHGKLGPSAMVLGLSIVVPIVGSIVIYHERITSSRVMAIALALAAVVLVSLDKKHEEEQR